MEEKAIKILRFLEQHQSEEMQAAYIDSLFNKQTSASEALFNNSKENMDAIRDFMYYDPFVSKKLLNNIQKAAEKHGVSWVKKFVETQETGRLYEINKTLFESKTSRSGERRYVKGKTFTRDLGAIKEYREWDVRSYNDYLVYASIRDEMRAKLFEMIADGKAEYPLSELKEFYFMPKKNKQKNLSINHYIWPDEWPDETNILENPDKYPGYLRAMDVIEKRIIEKTNINDLTFEQKKLMLEQTRNEDVLKSLLATGMTISLEDIEGRFSAETLERIVAENKILKDQLENKIVSEKNEEISKKLEATRKCLQEKEQQVTAKEAQIERERKTSVNVSENLQAMTDLQKKENFDAKKKLMTEHPIMTEACLNSMFTSYYLMEDKELKCEMLSDLYVIRKGGEKNKDKRDMAKTFKRVLDRNPGLKKDENLVALSKIDTPFAQPTKSVKKQITR